MRRVGRDVQFFGLLCLVNNGPQAPLLALDTARSPGTQGPREDHQTDPKESWRPRTPEAPCSKAVLGQPWPHLVRPALAKKQTSLPSLTEPRESAPVPLPGGLRRCPTQSGNPGGLLKPLLELWMWRPVSTKKQSPPHPSSSRALGAQ